MSKIPEGVLMGGPGRPSSTPRQPGRGPCKAYLRQTATFTDPQVKVEVFL
ncbi:hypothetical protein BH11PSE1_BH11PSE1_12480 [soil metagenome]